MGRDLLNDPYGRFYYLPMLLAKRGHDVRIVLLDYRNDAPESRQSHGIRWSSAPASGYLQEIRRQVTFDRPDWVIGFSDTYFGILASHYARKYDLRACIDAYDNYESYMRWAGPLHWLWRRALARADLVTAAGPALISLMTANRANQSSAVVPMAADPIGFEPLDKTASRQALELPDSGMLVGYCGSLHKSRGVETFFEAIRQIHEKHPDIHFVHSGRTWKNVPLPETLMSLGYIDENKMPALLNSMDTLVVVNRASAFGQYSHPVKLYEAMSCQVPAVATRTLATQWILEEYPERLVAAEDAAELSAAIVRSLNSPRPSYQSVPTWETSCKALEQALVST